MKTWLWILIVLLWVGPAFAQDSAELAKNNPVGLVALVSGGCEIKKLDEDWQRVYWLTLLRPEDRLRTTDNSKLVIGFFADDHQEILESSSEAKVAFRGLTAIDNRSKIRREQARDRGVTEIAIPYMLMRKLFKKDFQQADDPEAMEKENVFLASTVHPEDFPPVFDWKNVGNLYRIQLFNEYNEVIWETRQASNHLKYPYNAPFKLAKNSQYYWQVIGANDRLVVRKYPFTLLTLPHAQELERKERNFAKLRAARQAYANHYTDMFLLYNNRRLIDRSLKILREMSAMDPENPVIYRALVRAYLDKGCPAHAQAALDKETRFNGTDPVRD